MKATKKLLSLVMVLMMVVSTMVILPLTAHAEGLADLGSGTQADPYVIDSPADMMIFSGSTIGVEGQVTYFELGADIDMAGIEGYQGPKAKADIKESNNYFGSPIHFDGKGYTISNLTTTAGFEGGTWTGGLFGMLRGNDVVKNVTLENVTVNGTQNYAGGLIGLAKAPTTVENCKVTGSVTANESNTEMGGFIGATERTGYDVTFINCTNEATVTGSSTTKYIGGFIGNTHDATEMIFTNCTNKGTVTGGAVTENASGFIGRVQSVSNLTMTDCLNTATVSASAAVYVGGMVGFYEPDGTKAVTWTFTNCGNTGNISGKEYSGGLVGCLWGNPISGTFTACFNTGTTVGKDTGGLFGYYQPMKSATATRLINCLNVGASEGTKRAGGFAGKMAAAGGSTLYMENCVNTQAVPFFKEMATQTSEYTAEGVELVNCASAGALTTSSAGSVVKDFATVNVAADAATIGALQVALMTPVISAASKNLSVRLKLTDGFGLMAITNAPASALATEVGFYFSTDAENVAVPANKVAGSKNYNGGVYAFNAVYDDLKAASLGETIYFAAYVVVDGAELVSEVRSINCAELAEDLTDGYLGDATTGTLVTENAAEMNLYAAMVTYYEKYAAYLNSVTPA